MRRVRVFVHSTDAITSCGLECLLRSESAFHVLAGDGIDTAGIAVIGAADLEEARVALAGVQRDGHPPVMLVLDSVDGEAVVDAAELGARGILRRCDVTIARLASGIDRVVRGFAVVPEDLVGALLEQAVRRTSAGSRLALSDRERDVLRLLSEGSSTIEIGHSLGYSERTVKGVIHDLTTRHQLRNRSHAVAFALRNGMI